MTRKFAIAPFGKSSTTRTRWIPAVSGQLQANYDRLLKDLDLLGRARSEGVENRPAQQSRDLDVAQREALNAVEAGGNMLRQFLDAGLAEARDLITVRTPKLLDADVAASDAALNLRRAELAETETLVDLWKEQERALRQMNSFKRFNRLDREPMYAKDFKEAWGLIIGLLLGEALINASAFSLAGGGLAAGYLLAWTFAFANLSIGLITGTFGLRLMWHVRGGLRLLGVLFTALGVMLGLWANYFIASYREALHEGVGNEVAAAFHRSMALGSLTEMSAPSTGLMLIGLVFLVVAIQKGAGGENSPHDPYLRFCDFARPWDRASTAYATAKAACLERMKATIAAAEDAVRSRIQNEARQVEEAKDIAEQAVQRADEVADSIVEWKEMGSTLLSAYRNENLAVRTAPAPDYFTVFPDLRAMEKGVPDGSEIRSLAATATQIHQTNVAEAAKLNRALASLHSGRLEAFTAFIDAIERRGRQEVNDAGAHPAANAAAAPILAPQTQH